MDITVTDSTHSVDTVSVYYRKKGDLIWKSQNAVFLGQGSSEFKPTITIPHSDLSEGELEYYIEAKDDLSVGSLWPLQSEILR